MIACVISPQLDRLEKIPQVEAEPAGSDHGYDSTEKRPDATWDGIVPDLPTRIEEKEDDRSRNKDLVSGHNRHSAPLTFEAVRRLYYISPCTASFAGKARYLQAGRRPRWALPLGPTVRGGPPPLIGLSPGPCGLGWTVTYILHRTIPKPTRDEDLAFMICEPVLGQGLRLLGAGRSGFAP